MGEAEGLTEGLREEGGGTPSHRQLAAWGPLRGHCMVLGHRSVVQAQPLSRLLVIWTLRDPPPLPFASLGRCTAARPPPCNIVTAIVTATVLEYAVRYTLLVHSPAPFGNAAPIRARGHNPRPYQRQRVLR